MFKLYGILRQFRHESVDVQFTTQFKTTHDPFFDSPGLAESTSTSHISITSITTKTGLRSFTIPTSLPFPVTRVLPKALEKWLLSQGAHQQ